MSTIANRSSFPPIDCTGFAHVNIKPHPGMTGNGILLITIGNAYLVLLFVVTNYFLAFDPNKEPAGKSDGSSSNSSWQPNTIDQRFLSWIRRSSRITPTVRVRLQFAFEESITLLCNYHIVTGLVHLCIAYSLLIDGLDVGHWHIIVYLAWFSAAIHLSGLNVLRTHDEMAPWIKHARVFLMSGHFILLIVALAPTGFFSGGSNVASEAICYFTSYYGWWRFEAEKSQWAASRVEETEQWQAMLLSIVLLIPGFTTSLFKLCRPLSAAFRSGVRQPLSGWCRRHLRHLRRSSSPSCRSETLRSNLITKPALALFFMARLSCDLFSSRLFEISWFLVILLWGTIRIFGARNALISQSHDISTTEDQWKFNSNSLLVSISHFISIFGAFNSRVGLFEMLAIFRSRSRAQMSSANTANSLRGQDHPHKDVISSRGILDSCEDVSDLQKTSTLTPTTPDIFISSDEEGDLQYLDDYSGAPWLPICAAIPLLSILPAAMFLFLSSNSDKSMKSPLWFYEIRVSKSNLLYFSLVSYPCACATTIRFGMGMDLSSRWKKLGFFWLCLLVYAVHFCCVIWPAFFPFDGFTEGWFKIAPYTKLGVILPLYTSYITYCLVVA